MLCFPSISSRLKCSQISGEDLTHFENIIDSFPIHSVHLLIPNLNSSFKEKCKDVLLSDENIYFIVKDVTITSLIQSDFLEHFVKAGILLGVSHNARIGIENFISIISPGKLVLSLEKNIAKCLALYKKIPPGKKTQKQAFQTIIINLNSPEFSPGKKLYEFISSELSKIDDIKFNLLLKWEPHGNICPQSMKLYFTSKGFECVAYKPKHKYNVKHSIPVPKISYDMSNTDGQATFLEWIGMQICGIEYSANADDYACNMTIPELSETVNCLHNCSFEGFYSKTDVLPVIKEMRKLLESDSSLPFLILCVSGYQDSYVVANNFQHFSSEDKFVCIIIFPSSKYWVIKHCR